MGALDTRLEKIFEAWYDYDHALDEDQKEYNRDLRARLIKEALRAVPKFGGVGDFLHAYLPKYRRWVISRGLSKRRF